ncbi:MAG: transcriptional regulator [Propioniciclava sp.]
MPPAEMDELIHAPTRLRIMSVLVELGLESEIAFARLQAHLEMTPGNLSAHLKRLEKAS